MSKLNTVRIMRKFEEDPVPFIAASAGLLIGISKIITAVGNSRGSHAYARDVNRRVKAAKTSKS